MLTSDCLADSEAAVYKHCVGMGWTVNESRSRDLACLSDSWMLGKMKVISNAVIDKIQAYPRPMRVLQLQVYVGILWALTNIYTTTTYTASPFMMGDLEGYYVGLDKCSRICFLDPKKSIAQLQALGVIHPFILTISIGGNVFDWGLWKK